MRLPLFTSLMILIPLLHLLRSFTAGSMCHISHVLASQPRAQTANLKTRHHARSSRTSELTDGVLHNELVLFRTLPPVR